MAPTKTRTRVIICGVAALVFALVSIFFVFYTARLLYVTHGLQTIRAGGQGTYLGAIGFPVLAVLFGFGAWRLIGIARRA